VIFRPHPRWVIHPVLVTIAYVLNTALVSEVTAAGYVRAVIVAAFAAGVLTAGAWALMRNRWDGALLATAAIVILISPVSVAWVWYALRTAFGLAMGTLLMFLTLSAALGGVAIRLLQLRRRRMPLPRPAPETLNVLSIALLGSVIALNAVGHAAPDRTPMPPPAGWQADSPSAPDIVVILLDGYPRSDVLERRLGADNSSFLAGLRQRGFDVGTANHSNYTITELTFPSMFQMRYIDEMPSIRPLLGTDKQENEALRAAIEAGEVFSILDAAGYQTTIWAAGWEHVALRDVADRFIDSGELNDLERSVIHRTWLLYLLDAVRSNIFTDSQRNRIVHAFDALDRMAVESASAPKFLFVHVPAPHLPLVVRSDGSPADLTASRYEGVGRGAYGMNDKEFAAAWQGEIDYIDARTINAVDLMLSTGSGRNAVIIVMSDHGYGFELQPGDVQARLGNLFAARTPNAPGLFANSPTPVNLFAILFNQYLGTDIPTSPDRYFIQAARQLDLTEVDDPEQVTEP
jgi:hypothetical protein